MKSIEIVAVVFGIVAVWFNARQNDGGGDHRGEYPTALQYSVFLGLAVSGLVQWRRSVVASS